MFIDLGITLDDFHIFGIVRNLYIANVFVSCTLIANDFFN